GRARGSDANVSKRASSLEPRAEGLPASSIGGSGSLRWDDLHERETRGVTSVTRRLRSHTGRQEPFQRDHLSTVGRSLAPYLPVELPAVDADGRGASRSIGRASSQRLL